MLSWKDADREEKVPYLKERSAGSGESGSRRTVGQTKLKQNSTER